VGAEAELPGGRDLASFERELALVDRVLGLQAQLAQLAAQSSLTPDQQLRTEQELALLRGSVTWRAGRVVSAPLRALQRVARRPSR
jgi:hypothetical protein